METQVLNIGVVTLEWSKWYTFEQISIDQRKSEIKLPQCSGVYEATENPDMGRLTIGKTNNIKDRLKCLIRGNCGHSAGQKIKRAYPDSIQRRKFYVRFAETSRPYAAEEELHRLHILQYSALPKFTDR